MIPDRRYLETVVKLKNMPGRVVDPKTYPRKPASQNDFKKPVAWFGGRELIASLKSVVIYAINGENIDPRSWMNPNIFPSADATADKSWKDRVTAARKWKAENFDFWAEYFQKHPSEEEFWFDFIADTGDGQIAVYNVGCLCLADLWLDGSDVSFKPDAEKKLLPRGSFLFVGGDTAYHTANYQTLYERFQIPFRWAFESVRKFQFRKYQPNATALESHFLCEGIPTKIVTRNDSDGIEFNKNWDGTMFAPAKTPTHWDTEPLRPIFGIPANHDYYDAIDGFNRQFRRSWGYSVEENRLSGNSVERVILNIPTFSREQEASYIALKLPSDWWFFGIDSEIDRSDPRQDAFFQKIVNKKPKKLIIATPEPTTVFGRKCHEEDKTAKYMRIITGGLGLKQPFLNGGEITKIDNYDGKDDPTLGACRLDLSGDVHHYARYWGPVKDVDVAELSSENYASVVAGGGGAFFDVTSTLIGETYVDGKTYKGEVPPQKIFPNEQVSISRTAERLFDLRNVSKSGYIQHFGAIIAICFFFLLTDYSYISETLNLRAKNISERAANFLGEFFTSTFWSSFIGSTDKKLTAVFMVTIALGLTLWGALNVNRLIAKIKSNLLAKRADDAQKSNDTTAAAETDEKVRQAARIGNLLWHSLPFLSGIAVYAAFLAIFPLFRLEIARSGSSYFLLVHLLAAAILLWLSFEYTNWLALRFKVSRRLLGKTFAERMEDPNESAEKYIDDVSKLENPGFFYHLIKIAAKTTPTRFVLIKLLQLLGILSRVYSYQFIPAFVPAVLAALALIFGINRFGNQELGRMIADLFLIVMTGLLIFILIYSLAYSVGGAYQDRRGKVHFLVLGIWHAILQLSTPFVLYFYTNWILTLVIVFGFLVLTNGLSVSRLLKKARFDPAWSKTRLCLPIGECVMNFCYPRKNGKWLMFFVWLLVGSVVLAANFGLSAPTLNDFAMESPKWIRQLLGDWAPPMYGHDLQVLTKAAAYVIDKGHVWITVILVGTLGHRLSRIWFSWYLGTSVLFNGHNNEAGGMARIEEFKHLVRIRVTKEKLTAYVIGIENNFDDVTAETKLKLVDEFEIVPKKST